MGTSAVALVALIVVLAVMAVARMVYDDSETYANTSQNPGVITAVPVGDNSTAVLYGTEGWPASPFDVREDNYVAFLDQGGHYLSQPTKVPELNLLPSEQHDPEAHWTLQGTASGATLVYVAKVYGSTPQLRSLVIGATDGTASGPFEAMPGLNASGFHLVTAASGDTVHVLLWKEHHYSYHPLVNESGVAYYLRSPDGGRTWEEPLELMYGNATAAYAAMAAHDDVVSVLLVKLLDPYRGYALTRGAMFQSFDSGATFGPPVALSGDEIGDNVRPEDVIGLGEDGSMLVEMVLSDQWDAPHRTYREVYCMQPSGVARRVPLAEPLPTEVFMPVWFPNDTPHFKPDVFVLRSYDLRTGRYNFSMMDLNGAVIDKWEADPERWGYSSPIAITRLVDGKYQGIGTHTVDVSKSDIWRQAAEILLVEQDPRTLETRTIGQPYEVVFQHREAVRTAYIDTATRLGDVAWALFALTLATGLVATVASRSPGPWSAPDRAIAALLGSMAVGLPLLLVAGTMTTGHEHYWQPELSFIGLFYVAQGIIAIELLARTSFNARFVRFLHLPFGLLGTILVLAYASPWEVHGWDRHLLLDLVLLVWGCLWFLLIATPLRLDRLTGIGRRPVAKPLMWSGFIVLWVTAGLMLIMLSVLPFLVLGGLE